MAILSIMALYDDDPTVFDDFVIPTEDDITDDAEKIEDPFIPDKETLIDYICMETAELSLVYADPDVMRKMIKIWSRINNPVWCGLYNTLLYKYNPIWNKDADSLETRAFTGTNNETRNLANSENETRNLAGSDNETRNLANSEQYSGSGSETKTNLVTGYDANTFSNNTRDEIGTTGSGSSSGTDTGTVNRAKSDTGTISRSGTDTGTDNRSTSDNGTITKRETGNIGVQTTQSMIKEQREIVKFNLYQTIADAFKEYFCVMIY